MLYQYNEEYRNNKQKNKNIPFPMPITRERDGGNQPLENNGTQTTDSKERDELLKMQHEKVCNVPRIEKLITYPEQHFRIINNQTECLTDINFQ